MSNPLEKVVSWLHKWGFFTDTRRKRALIPWQEHTKALVSQLEKEMDPFIARIMHNEQYCSALYLLPEEILIRVLEILYQDEVSIFIIRQVSRKFRLLLRLPQFQYHRFAPVNSYTMPTAQNGGDILFEDPVTFRKSLPSPPRLVETEEDAALRAQIAILLHIDSYCIKCLERDRPERRGEARLCQGYCKFRALYPHTHYCDACGLSQPGPMFSKEESRNTSPYERRDCNGILGNVRLCEHEVVTWALMRVCLSQCQAMAARGDPGPDSVFEVDVKTCLHVSHQHTACTSNAPRARLIFHNTGKWRLELSWEPHSGPVSFFSHHTGKFNAVGMRNQFRQYRRSAAQYIVPEIAHDVLPEMTCFRIGECDCLDYGNDARVGKLLHGEAATLVQDYIRKTHIPLHADTEVCSHQQPYETAQHTHVRVNICQDANKKDASESPCIVTSYKRIIEGFCPGPGLKAIPSHDWFHAMDRSSYNSPTTRRIKESCKDPSCKNSYALSILGCYDRDLQLHQAAKKYITTSKRKKDVGQFFGN